MSRENQFAVNVDFWGCTAENTNGIRFAAL